ncbi:hypothetical protein Pfo_025495 [Paulownia fortunei]|nr:hypothetical protein Pfo_025495 [Paulownia fortunei]
MQAPCVNLVPEFGVGNAGQFTMEQLTNLITTAVDVALRMRDVNPPPPPLGLPEKSLRPERLEESHTGECRSKMKEPDVSEKLKDLHNELKEMKMKMAGRNTVTKRGIPFTEEVMMDDLPANFRSLNYDYDGTTDPWEHLCRFENSALLHRYSDGVKCRVFLTTLSKSAQQWFSQLPPNSINSFEEFSYAFLHQFASSRKHQKTSLTLFSIKQKDNEALRSYIKRFTTAALEVPSATQEDGEFFRSLAKKSARSFDDQLARAEKYINMEEAQRMKRDEGERKRERREKLKPEERPLLPIPGEPRQYTPLVAPRAHILMAIAKHKAPTKPKSNLFCVFCNEYGHNTEECRHLKDEIERVIKKRWLDDWIERDTKEGKAGAAPGENHYHTPRGFIQMILGGPTDGDSNRARKAYARSTPGGSKEEVHKINEGPVIQFGPHDMVGLQAPHNDALVITAIMANFDVARIMVDIGSSVDVLFYEAYKKMNLNITLQPRSSRSMGQVILPISLGTEPMRKTRMVKFLVVDSFSAYNIILGRPSLNTFQAVVSTFHMNLKFLVDKGIEEVEGDQCSARRCYVEAAERPSKEQEHVMPNEELINIELIPGDGTRTTRIGTQLSQELIDDMTQFLRNNIDIFAWNVRDLEGIDPSVAVHHLNVDPTYKPVKQKRRHFGPEKDKVIQKEVEKLLEAGHIREIQFPEWLSNIVLVPKIEGKWRMCIDFRDLNKACPKDHYPLPRIDQLVDSTSGCELLSMMDTSQGYHQIMLAPEDHKKVSFITSTGTYCYVVMPFRLKNAGATYQRLVDRMFKEQLGRNMEVEAHIADLTEAFRVLRIYGMKLNPSKCAFGVRSGKFLGYMVIERGIEVNPEKVKAVQNMAPPNSINKVQQLTGRIAALSRFISRSTERSLPFFKILRKADKFEWTEECQRAFDKLKNFLAKLPLLTKPMQGETLYVYLSVGTLAVSSVLLRDERAKQKPIYYISKLLRGAEIKYPEIEKGGLALITTARRLRPYFLSYKIVIRTNLPLRQVLGKLETSGRMVKWAVEMSEYDIDYQSRVAIKAQALTDFLQEMTPTDEVPEAWLLHVDGSATISDCGASIVLTGPEGEELEFAVRFEFKTSNNEAEYEALVRGLKMALELGVKQLSIFSDSRLVMQQVRGEFMSKEKRMRSYVEQVSQLKEQFTKIDLNHIPRAENVKADYLAKIASSTTDCKTRKITLLTAYQHSMVIEIASMEEKDDRRTNILKYLREGKLPQNKREVVRFQRAYSTPYLRCLSQEEGAYVLREIHEGGYGSHGGGQALACKTTRAGYSWPSLKEDAQHLVRTCEKCQKHASLIHKPAEELKVMSSPCPFSKWGIDIVGPFPLAIGQRKFLIVAVDYFNKWIEAEPVAKITESQVMKFLWGSIVCRYGVPRDLISDNGTQFQGKKIQSWCANGQVEVTNRIILQGIKTRLDRSGGETPFSLVYGVEAVIPADIGMETHRIQSYDEEKNNKLMREALDWIDEKREKTYLRMEVGDLVLRRADALKQTGKLEANWEGPYKVTQVIAGGAYELEDERGNKILRPWNICHLKKFYM